MLAAEKLKPEEAVDLGNAYSLKEGESGLKGREPAEFLV